MRLPLILSISWFFLFSGSSVLGNFTEPEASRDTTTAVVIYNAETRFLPQEKFTAIDYTRMIDSLVMLDTVPVHLINQLSIYSVLADKDAVELELIIDSIFDLDNVPQPVLNAVNMYMTTMEEVLARPRGFYAYVPESDSPYPSDIFYKDWNTEVPNPYRNNLSLFDSTMHLMLVDSAQNCGFYPPRKGIVTSHFGWRYGRNHNGIDLDLAVWDPVYAAFPGVVRVSKYYKGGY